MLPAASRLFRRSLFVCRGVKTKTSWSVCESQCCLLDLQQYAQKLSRKKLRRNLPWKSLRSCTGLRDLIFVVFCGSQLLGAEVREQSKSPQRVRFLHFQLRGMQHADLSEVVTLGLPTAANVAVQMSRFARRQDQKKWKPSARQPISVLVTISAPFCLTRSTAARLCRPRAFCLASELGKLRKSHPNMSAKSEKTYLPAGSLSDADLPKR